MTRQKFFTGAHIFLNVLYGLNSILVNILLNMFKHFKNKLDFRITILQ